MQTSTDTPKTGAHATPHRFYTTGDFLDLIMALREHDPGAASHTLVGLLRMASENTATPVEQTALRIAGLADIEGKQFVLTATARELLYHFSTGDYSGSVRPGRAAPKNDDDDVDDLSSLVRSSEEPEPLARLQIGGKTYMVGEIPSLDMLAFRPDEGGEWIHLENTVEEGWSAIAAEIISKTRDTTREYIRMHMIHRRNVDAGEGVRLFDLYGFEWYIKLNDEGVQSRLADGKWTPVNADGLHHEDDLGEIAVRSLLTAMPDAKAHFMKDVNEWARRIAAGASIMPAFTI